MRKKVAILTIHVGINFGSVLQTIATSEIIKRLGFLPIIVNYIPERATLRRYIRGAFSSPVKLLWRTIFLPVYLKNNSVYRNYLQRHVELSAPIYDSDDFTELCPMSDAYVVGSDQVWNSIHNEGFNGRYFFEGIDTDSPKIAFCSSFGRNSIDEEEQSKVRSLLSGFKAISVREDSGVNILRDMGIEAGQLVDPTFLFTKEDWTAYASPRIEKNPYVLIYTPYNTVDSSIIYRAARRLADNHGLKIVTFSWTAKRDSRVDRTAVFANPGDFLSLMLYAKYVITNSFHGTAFSINLNKQFWVFQPSAFSTRIESILNLTGLKDRMLTGELTDNHEERIDYDKINAILDSERLKSIDFLKKALN